jgi:hypothetical protein
MKSTWLSYVNLSDAYERKARLLPAVLTLIALIPLAIAVHVPLQRGITVLLGGVGMMAVLSVGLSHLSSAFGNRIQRRLWPRWPHDSPSNLWLQPGNGSRSTQQKELWYAAIRQLTGLDIPAAGTIDQQELVINDAVARLRNLLWKSEHSSRLDIHNVDFGFARNLTGLRPVWLTGAAVAAGLAWYRHFRAEPDLESAALLTTYFLVLTFLGFAVLPAYTRQRADHYAESFFAAVMSLANSERK